MRHHKHKAEPAAAAVPAEATAPVATPAAAKPAEAVAAAAESVK